MKKLLLSGAAMLLASATIAVADGNWPDLPTGFKSGIFGQSGSMAYMGLGSAGSDLYAMDLGASDKSWEQLAPFPGPSTNGAAFTMAGGKLFVFSGAGKENADDASPIIFTTAYSFDPVANAWTKLETETPVGLLGATAHAINDDQIAFFGGYNKELFDQYLNDVLTTDKEAEPEAWQKIVDDYMGMAPEAYLWNDEVLVYTISTNAWSDLGENPYRPNTGSALVEYDDGIMLINGEIKPGLRTPRIKHVSFGDAGLNWTELPQLPALAGAELQEGLASPFAGTSNGAVIVAGGANFHGARARSFAEDWFTHSGFPKAFNDHMYVMVDGAWKPVNSMPEGLAYGASFQTADGVLAVGGEDSERAGRSEAFLLTWDGTSVIIED